MQTLYEPSSLGCSAVQHVPRIQHHGQRVLLPAGLTGNSLSRGHAAAAAGGGGGGGGVSWGKTANDSFDQEEKKRKFFSLLLGDKTDLLWPLPDSYASCIVILFCWFDLFFTLRHCLFLHLFVLLQLNGTKNYWGNVCRVTGMQTCFKKDCRYWLFWSSFVSFGLTES